MSHFLGGTFHFQFVQPDIPGVPVSSTVPNIGWVWVDTCLVLLCMFCSSSSLSCSLAVIHACTLTFGTHPWRDLNHISYPHVLVVHLALEGFLLCEFPSQLPRCSFRNGVRTRCRRRRALGSSLLYNLLESRMLLQLCCSSGRKFAFGLSSAVPDMTSNTSGFQAFESPGSGQYLKHALHLHIRPKQARACSDWYRWVGQDTSYRFTLPGVWQDCGPSLLSTHSL